MQKHIITYVLLFTSFAIYTQNLEDRIYQALDTFTENPSISTLNTLSEKERQFEQEVHSPKEQLALVILQCNKAYFENSFGQSQNAIANYEKAWKSFKNTSLHDYDIIEYCLKPLGNLYTITGNYTGAENTIKQYIFMAAAEKNEGQRIAGIINLSVVYHNTGNYQTAVSILENELKSKQLTISQKNLIQNNLATNYIALNNPEKAQALVDQNLRSGTPNPYTSLKNTSQIALRQGDTAKAGTYLNRAKKELFSKKGVLAREVAKFYVEEAQLFFLQNKVDKAKRSLEKALKTLIPNESELPPNKETLYAENTFIDVFDAFALLESNTDNALKYYELSFYVASLLETKLTSQEAKLLNQLDNRTRSERCIERLYSAFLQSQDSGYIKEAFQYAEKSKSIVLKEIIAKKSLVEKYPKDTLLQQEQLLLQQQEQLTNTLIQAQLQNLSPHIIQEATWQLNKISLQLKEVLSRISKKYPIQYAKPVNLKELQRKIGNDNIVLAEYFYGKNNLYLFIVEGNSMTLKSIGLNDSLTDELRQFIQLFETSSGIGNNLQKYTQAAFGLYQKLQLNSISAYKNVMIVPDGLLYFLPFEALLTSKTTSLQFQSMPFVVKDHQIAYQTSVEFYLKTKKGQEKDMLLGFFPVFEKGMQPLTYSLEEAKAIESHIPSTILTRKEANKENFLKKIRDYNIVHLSTHADGGTFTIPPSIHFYDEALLLYELYALNIHPKLVILSACETGIGKLQRGEGAMSIARGFQYAGATSVLFSLWNINDRATAKLMDFFYKNYAQNHSAFLSGHKSKIDYLSKKDISNAKKSPYYWSAFVYYGDMGTIENFPSARYWPIPVFLLILIVLFLVWKMQKNDIIKKNSHRKRVHKNTFGLNQNQSF